MSKKLWEPSPEQVAGANLTRYMAHLRDRHGLDLESFDHLYQWSVAHREDFWASLWDFCGVIHSCGYDSVLENGDDMLASRWFTGARLNYAENLLRFRDDREALVFRSENPDVPTRSMSYRELHDEVARVAHGLREMGVTTGDRVVGFMANMIETVVAMLAASSLGAVWSSCSPDFGFQGVLDRFGQIKPKVLFAADGYFYNGRWFDSLGKVRMIIDVLPTIERVVMVPYVHPGPDGDWSGSGQGGRQGGGQNGKPESGQGGRQNGKPESGQEDRQGGGQEDRQGGGQNGKPESGQEDRQGGGQNGKPESGQGDRQGGGQGSMMLDGIRGGIHYHELVSRHSPVPPLTFQQLPFDHPLYILYSSGTTGVPKCMVHGAGGTLLQHLKELVLHTDLKRSDRIFYFTTCGWMMWNWLVSSLAAGATVLLFDGSPFHPHPGVLWQFARDQGMTVFGTSARYIAALEKEGLKPGGTYDLASLRAILSTGSPLSVESFEFVYRDIKSDLQLASISGGSDIVSCFALGNPTGPVWAGELQTRGLGMNVQVFDGEGNPVRGQKGELVCTASFPCQPVCFWNDADGSRYRRAYFEVYPNVWHHGDYAELTPRNGMIIYGRSDATLNPGGVRIGTAEIYRPVEAMEEIADSLVVGQNWEGDVRVVLFVRLVPGIELDGELAGRIRREIRSNCTPRHVPAKIIRVEDIPYTISGKKVELAVQKVINREEVLNRDALKNPEALELFRDLEELKM